MTGTLDSGLPYAQEGEVRVVLYLGTWSGTVQIKAADGWRIAKKGEVSYGTIIELTRMASCKPAK